MIAGPVGTNGCSSDTLKSKFLANVPEWCGAPKRLGLTLTLRASRCADSQGLR
jgi:hypothetical protein